MSFGMSQGIRVPQILRRCFFQGSGSMSLRPFYYSGRGAIRSDLEDKQLEAHWMCIKSNEVKEVHDPETEFPLGASEAFVQMVASIPKLSATDYLKCLHALCRRGWVWDDAILESIGVSGISVGTKDDPHVGVMGIIGALCGDNDRDETGWIRGAFLARRGVVAVRGQGSRGHDGYTYDESGYYWREEYDCEGHRSFMVYKD